MKIGLAVLVATVASCDSPTVHDSAPRAQTHTSVGDKPLDVDKAVAVASAYETRSPTPNAREDSDRVVSDPPPEVSGAPPVGCVRAPYPVARLWSRPGPVALTVHQRAFVAAGYAPRPGGGEELFIVSADAPSSLPRTLRAVSLRHPLPAASRIGAPGLLSLEAGLLVAVIDAAGGLSIAELGEEMRWSPLELAQSVDTRFQPALVAIGAHYLVAWVKRGTPMHIEVAELEPGPRMVARHRVTPPSMSGTAPVFVPGSAQPTLVFMDARAGVSNLLAVRFQRGVPAAAEVLRPVGSAAPLPHVAAVVRGPNELAVAYAVVGSAATTAIGLVQSSDDAHPLPLVPGTGYGVLTVAAARRVFVASAPRAESPEAPRELHVRSLETDGSLGTPLVIRGTGPTARRPSLAAADETSYAVAYDTGESVELVRLRCAR